VLKRNGQNGKVPVTGQDATDEGLTRVLTGDQCMTVYKAIKKEADAAAKIAIDLINGKTPSVSDKIDNGSKTIPAQFETPVAVTKDNIKDYIGEPDFPKREEICAGKLASKCKAIGL